MRTLPMLICVFGAGLLLAGGPVRAQSPEAGNADRGHAFAVRTCAGCHAIERGQPRTTKARPATFETIANTPGMTDMALSVWLRSPHPTMPNFILEPEQIRDVTAYIGTLRDPK